MPYPQVSPPTDHGAFSPGQDDPLNRRTTTQRRRLLITGIISIALLLFVGQFSKANTGEATDALERAWHRMGAQQLELPPCEKTFLYSFSQCSSQSTARRMHS